MSLFFKVSSLALLFLTVSLTKADESIPLNVAKETSLPTIALEERHIMTLDEATKKVMQDSKNKVLSAKTELVAGKKVHIIKILTSSGHIQYIRFDAETGKLLDKHKK